ncbi:hypothetical protein F5884DRAFT_218274 [Xylogone sp. PMI_703]|nr:hypothetical protein F5884DRAFT_218274 [Xylogone sp. PMI_703]
MASKNFPLEDTGEESRPPPSYADTISNLSHPSQSTPYGAQINSLLLNLTNQVASDQTQRNLLNTARDSKALSSITSVVESYLSSFAKSGLRKGALILVPAGAVQNENAVPCEYDFADPAEFDRVLRVSIGGKEDPSNDLWFWKDEDMARRLAGYIAQPKLQALPTRPPEQQVARDENKSSSKGFWRKKSIPKSTDRPTLEQVQGRGSLRSDTGKAAPTNDGEAVWQYEVQMDVKAEEIVFRTENELGLYETERGWGIVLKLNVFPSN